MPECTGAVDCGCWGHVQLAQSGEKFLGEYEYVLDDRPGRWPYSLAKKLVQWPEWCVVHAAGSVEAMYVASARDSKLCLPCVDQLRFELQRVATCWDGASDALQRGTGAGRDGMRASDGVWQPLPIDANVSEALGVAREAVWSLVAQLVQDRPTVRLPDDQSTPALAEWLAKWHVDYVASHPSAAFTLETYKEVQAAAGAVLDASYGASVEVVQSEPCMTPIGKKPKSQQLIRCPGKVTLVQKRDGVELACCDLDDSHMVPADAWFRVMKSLRPQKRGARPPRV